MTPTWSNKKAENHVKSKSDLKPWQDVYPTHTQSRCLLAVCVCVCVSFLYPQVFGVEHSADEEQRPRRLVTDQVEEGPVHTVRQVAGRGAGTGVQVALGRRLHDDLVVGTDELGGLGCDLLQVWVVQPLRETCREQHMKMCQSTNRNQLLAMRV